MVKTQHDTSRFTSFGLLLDKLLQNKQMSYRQLAIASGMSAKSAMTIIRACRGESTPERENIFKWCAVLEATPEQRRALLHAFHYTEDEQGSALEQACAHIAELEQERDVLLAACAQQGQELEQARTRIRELEQDIAQLRKSSTQTSPQGDIGSA